MIFFDVKNTVKKAALALALMCSLAAPALAQDDFETPVAVTAVNSVNYEAEPSISADRLSLYLVRLPSGNGDIYVATRATTGDSFGAPAEVTALKQGGTYNEYAPCIASDDLQIFYSTDRDGTYDIYSATRASTVSAWNTPYKVANVNSAQNEFSPYITSDLLTLYLSSNRTGAAGYDIFAATRDSATAEFNTPVSVSAFNTADFESGVSIAPSQLLIYFQRKDANQAEIYYATRATTVAAWSTPAKVSTLNTILITQGDGNPDFTHDGIEIYFNSNRGGNWDIYSALAATFTPTPTATETPTETATETATETPTPTETEIPTSTYTPTSTATETVTQTPTETATETPTDTVTETPTETATETPTETVTETPVNTETPVDTATPTETVTPTPTDTGAPTQTPTETTVPTATSTPTNTPVPSASATETEIPTVTPTETEQPSATATETVEPTATATETEVPTVTPTNTVPPTATYTATATATNTPVDTATPTATATSTWTPTATPTATDTPTPTVTWTPTPTWTPTQTSTPVVNIEIYPEDYRIAVGQQKQFVALVQGSNAGVTWEVDGVQGGTAATGIITADGLYTAPSQVPSPAQVIVTARSIDKPNKLDTATVTITALVTVSPSQVRLGAGESFQFSSGVSGIPDTSVIWTVNGIEGGNSTVGTITQDGLYQAPARVRFYQTVVVRAVSETSGDYVGEARITLAPKVQLFILDGYGRVLQTE